jgi:ATP-dependent protease HslVU (ClpYQ) peptidase subunit
MKVPCDKLRENEHIAFAFVGSMAEGISIWGNLRLWSPAPGSSDGETIDGWQVVNVCEEDQVHGIVVEKATGKAFILTGKRVVFIPVETLFIALGSGAEFAMASMHHGASAEQAVETASVYDIYTGMGVVCCVVDGERQRVDAATHVCPF